MNWVLNQHKEWILTVPIELWENPDGIQDGEYQIHIVPRPPYCDRGDWLILVDGFNDLDYSDGFPRYFFGNDEEVKKQMETWINKRAAYQKHRKRSLNT
jgi:hypothetical protein